MNNAVKLALLALGASALAAALLWPRPEPAQTAPDAHIPDPPDPTRPDSGHAHPAADPALHPIEPRPEDHPHPVPGVDPTRCPMACDALVTCAGAPGGCAQTEGRMVLGACLRGCSSTDAAADALNAATDCAGRLTAARTHLEGFTALCPAR